MATHNELKRLGRRAKLQADLGKAERVLAADEFVAPQPIDGCPRFSDAARHALATRLFPVIFPAFVAWGTTDGTDLWTGEGALFVKEAYAGATFLWHDIVLDQTKHAFEMDEMRKFTKAELSNPALIEWKEYARQFKAFTDAEQRRRNCRCELAHIAKIQAIIDGSIIMPATPNSRALVNFIANLLKPERMKRVLTAAGDGFLSFAYAASDALGPGIDATTIVVTHVTSERATTEKQFTSSAMYCHVGAGFLAFFAPDGNYTLRARPDAPLAIDLNDVMDKAGTSNADELFRWISGRLRKCALCHAALTDDSSVERGIGPTCAKRWRQWHPDV